MNFDNIQVDMKIPNYKALCRLLDEPIKGGDSKKAQIKAWNRFFSFEREGNAFIIKEVYSIPLPTEDKRAKYLCDIEPILFSFLADCGGDYETTVRQWGIDIDLFDADIFDEDKQSDFIENYGTNPYILYRTVNDTASLFRQVLYSALSALQKKGLLVYETNLYVVSASTGGKHKASNSECSTYAALQEEIMHSLGCTNMQALYASMSKTKIYFNRLHEQMKKQHGWSNAYNLLRVSATGDYISHYDGAGVSESLTHLRKSLKATVLKQAAANEKQNTEKVYEAWDKDGFKTKVYQLPALYSSTMGIVFEEFMQW